MGDHRADPRLSARRPTSGNTEPGRRRAATPAAAGPRRVRAVVTSPLLLGMAALAASAGGVVTTTDSSVTTRGFSTNASGTVGSTAVAGVSPTDRRTAIVSRSSRRDGSTMTTRKLVLAAERQVRARNKALGRFAELAAARSASIELNQWYLPVDYVALTARYGEYGLWASSHTGLDFNGDEGDPVYAVATGVVTSVGYDGAYGNKTVLTLEDGTEIWYCHQSQFLVAPGDRVGGGEQIGAIGSTGNVTGSHLHLEFRPGGGGPADPYSAFASNDLF